MFEIIWSDSAAGQLKKLDRSVGRRIYEAVGRLAGDPFHNVIKVVGSDDFRFRIGDFRVFFKVENTPGPRIMITKVDKRDSAYD